MQLRWDIDLRIEPHIISISDYENNETPFVVEVKNTGIKVAQFNLFYKKLSSRYNMFNL